MPADDLYVRFLDSQGVERSRPSTDLRTTKDVQDLLERCVCRVFELRDDDGEIVLEVGYSGIGLMCQAERMRDLNEEALRIAKSTKRLVFGRVPQERIVYDVVDGELVRES